MSHKLPSLADIVNVITSLRELQQWATENHLIDHPIIKQRFGCILTDILQTFTDADKLVIWAIDNFLLTNQQVLQRIIYLQTCQLCNRKFDLSSELEQHRQLHDIDSNIEDPHTSGVQQYESNRVERTDATNVQSQIGTGNDNLPYIFEMTKQKTFSKNLAKETTYKIKFKDQWKGEKIRNILGEISTMFDDVLHKAKGNNESDMGRVIITHPELNNSIVVPLDTWSNINSNRIMQAVENVLNSEENLPLDTGMEIIIGNIAVPSGSGNLRITTLNGTHSSIALKKSMLRVSNDDRLCLATAIGRCFLKICETVPEDTWKEITKDDPRNMNTFMKVMKHRKTTKSYPKHVGESAVGGKNKSYSKTMALTLCKEANLPTDRSLTIRDIGSFEDLLDVNILVLSAKMGNKFYRVTNNSDRKNIYLYLSGDSDTSNGGHFDGIGNINGFFGYGYFCTPCLKPYKNKGKHSCVNTCDVCGNNNCMRGEDTKLCSKCHRTCRSEECYNRHKTRKKARGKDIEKSMCDQFYQCETCKKVICREKRKPEDHKCGEWKCKNCFEYQFGEHFCYQRRQIRESTKKEPRKYFFYDFETTQNEMMTCKDGYSPKDPPCGRQCTIQKRCSQCKICTNCARCGPKTPCSGGYVPSQPCGEIKCTFEVRCDKCRLCDNCDQSWCGLEEHKVNFAILQSTCVKCEQHVLTEDAKCNFCGSRCETCRTVKKNAVVLPCEDTCGYRQRVFKGIDVPSQFCSHIMTPHYKNTVLIAHNAKGFDNYPILNTLIDKHAIKPDKIIFDGSKINYMHVSKGLDLTFLDSINFIGMKLSKIPECFGLSELTKGYFPHLFNRQENQSYRGPYPDVRYYGIEYMSQEEAEKFQEWYATKENEIFDFQSEIYKYCVSDVDILRRGCMQFRKLMMEVTSIEKKVNEKEAYKDGIDPFDYMTIASACQAIYRELFLEEEYETHVLIKQNNATVKCPTKIENDGTVQVQLPEGDWVSKETIDSEKYGILRTVFCKSPIALVPSQGYVSNNNFSKVSIQWLEWEMELARRKGRPMRIHHALNEMGEHKVPGTKYRLDGYVESGTRKTAYEFLGE